MSLKLVSVILPNYNGEAFLKESIKSVLEQSYSNLELIIIDDGSTDNSRDIIESFHDSRIKTIYLQKNGQICMALNIGLKAARGEYIARIDSDDIWERGKLEKQIRVLEDDEQIGACFSYVNLINEHGEIVNIAYQEIYNLFRPKFKSQKEWLHFFVFSGNCLSHPSVVIKRSVLEKVGKYNISFIQSQDYELWMRIVLQYNLYVIPEELVKYRWMPDSKRNISANIEKNNTRFYNEYILAVYRLFNSIRDSDFQLFFKDYFINKEAKSRLEILCEKAFLCLKYDKTQRLYPIGIEILERIFREEEGINLLAEQYGFTIKDFYELNIHHIFNDTYILMQMNQYQQRIEALEVEINRTAVEVEKKVRTEYEDTKSWKITKPLRKGGQKLRVVKKNMQPLKFYLLGTEDYGNLGDHAIAIAENQFLKHYFPNIELIEVPASQYFSRKEELLSVIRKKDIIIGHGGGNIGNQSPVAESIRRDFIQSWPDNQIIIFPQTICFTNQLDNLEEEIKKTQEIYNEHNKLTLFVRERKSYNFAKDHFKCHIHLVPDIVLFMQSHKHLQRKEQILLCLRRDVEKIVTQDEEKSIKKVLNELSGNVCYVDTQKEYNISVNERKEEVDKLLDLMRSSKLVITDRMHGMIFAAITETPCVTLDNYNSKIKGTYEWIKELPYIYFLEDMSQMPKIVGKLYDYKPGNEYNNLMKLEKYYKYLAQQIKNKL